MSIALVAGSAAYSDAIPGTVSSVPYAASVGASSLFIVHLWYIVWWNSACTGDLTVSDTLGNGNYTKAYSSWVNIVDTQWDYHAVFYNMNTKGAGANTVNLTGYHSSTGSTYTSVIIDEVTGAAASPYDTIGQNIGTDGSYASGTQILNMPALSPAGTGELIYVDLIDDGGAGQITALTANDIYTIDQDLTGDTWGGSESGVYSGSGSYTPTFKVTTSGTGTWHAMVTAWTPAAGGANWLQEGYWWNNPYSGGNQYWRPKGSSIFRPKRHNHFVLDLGRKAA